MGAAAKRAQGARIRGSIELAGGPVAYEAGGEGPPVVFIHAMIADGRMWEREFERYSAGHQCIRYDLRGFGGSLPASAPFSYVEDLGSLLSHLGVRRPFLVGASMGGAVAISYALERPDSVRGLFLVAPGLSGGFEPPFEPAEQAAFEYDERKSREVARAWAQGDKSTAFELLRQLWCTALTGRSLALFREMVERNSAEVFEDRSLKLAISAPPAAGRLPTLRVPTTVLLGDQDNPSSECFATRIAGAIPGARLVRIRGADHLVNLSSPIAFDAALDAALAATDGPR
jgi:pimeloyl-ACP methyl ester carboxylesterase